MKTKPAKRILSLLLALVTLLSACGNPAKESDPSAETSAAEENTVYYELHFDNAEGTSEEDAGRITLPETALVPENTPIASLTTPCKDGAVFTGWYYDSALKEPVRPGDAVTKDMTLYPGFAAAAGTDGEMGLYYVASRDVAEDFSLILAADGLNVEEVMCLISLSDRTDPENVPAFSLTQIPPIDLEELVPDAELREALNALLAPEESGADDRVLPEAFDRLELSEEQREELLRYFCADMNDEEEKGLLLYVALLDTGLEEDVVERIMFAYAPDTARTLYRHSLREWLLELCGDNEEFAAKIEAIPEERFPEYSEAGLRELFGLSENESLELYLIDHVGLDPLEIQKLEERMKTFAVPEFSAAYYRLSPVGKWTAGDLYALELPDTEKLRFVYDGAMTGGSVTTYNFTVDREEVRNMRLQSAVRMIPAAHAPGVRVENGMYMVDTDERGELTATEREVSGSFTYGGDEPLAVGDKLAIYDGTLRDDGSVDGSVLYVILTDVEGRDCRYESASLGDVVFLPDDVPVRDDGSFEDGEIFVGADELRFEGELYERMGLSASTVVEPGDFITVYRGTLGTDSFETVGYGCITSASGRDGGLEIRYEPVSLDQMLRSANTFVKETSLELSLSDREIKELKKKMEGQALESGFLEEAGRYVTALATGGDVGLEGSRYAEELGSMTFLSADGGVMSLAEVRSLANGMKAEASKPSVSVNFSPILEHFGGTGIRLELAASFTVTIHVETNGNKNKLEIKCVAAFEQEVALGINIGCDAEWVCDGVYVPKEIVLKLALQAGTYTGLGAACTVTTSEEEADKGPWSSLISNQNNTASQAAAATTNLSDIAKNVEKMANGAKTVTKKLGVVKEKGGKGKQAEDGFQSPGIGGGLEEKYSNMLDNDAEYVTLLEEEIFSLEGSPDPLHLTAFSVRCSMFLKLKINAMLGFGVSYANCKQLSLTIRVFEGEASSGSDDLETPNFRSDFYIFGMIGIRAGVGIEFRAGLLSTSMDSVGVKAQIGLYAEVYGFLYVYYGWESGKGSSKGVMGSMLFEIGMFLDVSFKAQLGDDKLAKELPLVEKTWPFLQLGAAGVPLGFTEEDELTLEMKEGRVSADLPEGFFRMNVMSLSSGDVSEEDEDRAGQGDEAYRMSLNGREYIQYNEQHFEVSSSNRAFIYLPDSNRIMVYPGDRSVSRLETDITFTYLSHSFGLNTESYSRTVHVVWEGSPETALFQYYKLDENGRAILEEEEVVDGFENVLYAVSVDDALLNRYPGYELTDAVFPEGRAIEERLAFLEAHWQELLKREAALDPDDLEAYVELAVEALACAFNLAYARVVYEDYQQNILNVIQKKEGYFYYPMAKNTVVKFYYETPYVTVDYTIGEWKSCKLGRTTGLAVYTNVFDRGTVRVPYGTTLGEVLDRLPLEDGYTYVYTVPTSSLLDFFCTKSRIDPLDESTVLPKDETVDLKLCRVKASYTARFVVNGSVFAETEALFGDAVSFPGDPPGKTGYDFAYWAVNGQRIGPGYRMPAGGVTAEAVFAPRVHTVKWVADGQVIKTEQVAYGASLQAPEGETCRSVKWLLGDTPVIVITPEEAAGSSGGVSWSQTGGLLMPDNDVTLTAQYGAYSHVWDAGTVTKESNCSEAGVRTYTCSRCGGTRTEVLPIASDAHAWDAGTVTAEPNCRETGTMLYTCSRCGGTRTEVLPIVPDVHVWDAGTVTVAPACCAVGTRTYHCLNGCGATRSESIPAEPDAHAWDDGRVTREANCRETGTMLYTCSRCGGTRTEILPIVPDAHVWDAGTVTAEPTCSADGTRTCRCLNGCGETRSERIPAVPDAHVWDAGRVTGEANCCETGVKLYTCEACKATRTEVLPIVPDAHVWDEGTVTTPPGITAPGVRTCHCLNGCGGTKTEDACLTAEVFGQQVIHSMLLDWGYETLLEWCEDNLNEDYSERPGDASCFNITNADKWNGYLLRAFVGTEEVFGTFTLDPSCDRIIRELAYDEELTVTVRFVPDETYAGVAESDYELTLFGTNHQWCLSVVDTGYEKGAQILNQELFSRYDVPAGTAVSFAEISAAIDAVQDFRVDHSGQYFYGLRDRWDEDAGIITEDFVMPDCDLTLIVIWVDETPDR